MTPTTRHLLRISAVAATLLAASVPFGRPVGAWVGPGSGSSRCADDQLTWQATLTITNEITTHPLTVTGLRTSTAVAFPGLAIGTTIDPSKVLTVTARDLPPSMPSFTVSYDVAWPEGSRSSNIISITKPSCASLSTTATPTTAGPTTIAPTTIAPTTIAPTTIAPTTIAPTTSPTTVALTTTQPTVVSNVIVVPVTTPNKPGALPATGLSPGPVLVMGLLFAAFGLALWSLGSS